MMQRDADPTVPVEQVCLSNANSSDALEPPGGPTEADQEELLDYAPVPPRNTQTLVVRFRPGDRLRPLPYSLGEENP
ncbi:MAG: hypothetical protein ACLQVF_14220 [Isosphaeraceae bacterium]